MVVGFILPPQPSRLLCLFIYWNKAKGLSHNTNQQITSATQTFVGQTKSSTSVDGVHRRMLVAFHGFSQSPKQQQQSCKSLELRALGWQFYLLLITANFLVSLDLSSHLRASTDQSTDTVKFLLRPASQRDPIRFRLLKHLFCPSCYRFLLKCDLQPVLILLSSVNCVMCESFSQINHNFDHKT